MRECAGRGIRRGRFAESRGAREIDGRTACALCGRERAGLLPRKRERQRKTAPICHRSSIDIPEESRQRRLQLRLRPLAGEGAQGGGGAGRKGGGRRRRRGDTHSKLDRRSRLVYRTSISLGDRILLSFSLAVKTVSSRAKRERAEFESRAHARARARLPRTRLANFLSRLPIKRVYACAFRIFCVHRAVVNLLEIEGRV